MKYLELFRLGVHHAFYSNGISPDFTITPDSGTRSLLRNHRALVKPLPNGLRVVTSATDAGETFLPFSERARLRFDMRLDNPDFPHFTDLAEIAGLAAPIFVGSDSLELGLQSRTAWNRDVLRVVAPSAQEPFVLGSSPVEGFAASAFRLEPEDGPVRQVVGYDKPARRITIDSSDAKAGQEFAILYHVRPRRAPDVFAEIDIELTGALVNLTSPVQPAPEFRISFGAKRARWAYYCVTDLPNSLADFSVVDKPPDNGGVPVVFGDDGRTDLAATPDSSDRLAGKLQTAYPTSKHYRFLSRDFIACRQAARTGLRLQIGDNKLPGALATPSFKDPATIVIKVGDAEEKQDCLTEVVKIRNDFGV